MVSHYFIENNLTKRHLVDRVSIRGKHSSLFWIRRTKIFLKDFELAATETKNLATSIALGRMSLCNYRPFNVSPILSSWFHIISSKTILSKDIWLTEFQSKSKHSSLSRIRERQDFILDFELAATRTKKSCDINCPQ